MKRSIFTIVAVMLVTMLSYGQTKLSGTVVGTPDGLCFADKTTKEIFDGDFETAMDGTSAVTNDSWAGLDFGEGAQKNFDKIGFALRIPSNPNLELMRDRLAGAKVYGANTLTVPDTTLNAMSADTLGNLLYILPRAALDTIEYNKFANIDLQLNTETAYRYILIFFDAGARGNCSEFEVYGSDATATAISSSKTLKSFNAFLSNDDLMISSDREVQATVEVYSISGALVAKRTLDLFNGNNKVDLSTALIENNLYVVRVKAGNDVYSQKLLK